ncbi:uncharacterized protein LOC134653488 [Cydia amplana]|uniref:uncharacterized protein LOC134653488 n=1 Tax=Cydia amplana TaxID=1869771 RepID=UPI002FE62F81
MDKIFFTINGDKIAVSGSEVTPDTSLNDYIRNYLNLHGTKAMCHEGGCGACVVSVSQTHPTTGEKHVFAANSCLVHVLSCHDWDITTVEGAGNRKDGYHPIQKRLATFNGTQCGYCTPGWVMNMYSLYESSHKRLTMQQVEKSFGGNMCRCTGYRPILDAFKSFATDADDRLKKKVQDMEDLDKIKCLNKCEKKCNSEEDWCLIENKPEVLLQLGMNVNRWYKAYNIKDVFKVLSREGTDSYRLIAGNTGKGVYPITADARILIDISSITALKESYKDMNLVIGAGMPMTEVMATCTLRSNESDFRYLKYFYDHLDLVAHVPVRNIGTIGGNLALKAAHHAFPSDVFLLLETVEASVTIVNSKLEKTVVKMQDFLSLDLKDKLILNVKLPPLSENNHIRTYKIMPRAQNAHAIVNAGFLFRLTSNAITKCTLVFGNISPDFIRASKTEKALIGVNLEDVLKKGVPLLVDELVPVEDPPEPSAECRKSIAVGLFYKALLSIAPEASVNPRYASGGKPLLRPVSRGTQTFDTDKSLWPLNQPVPKLEALAQCSGEAKYTCDVNTSPREVHVAFVLSTICVGEIDKIDASEALKLPGVVSFFTAKDIPGKNSFTPSDVPWQESDEEILASSKVSYYGQPIGLIAAVSHKLALKAAGLVRVQYKNEKTPVLSIEDALKAQDKDRRVREDISVKPTNKGVDTTQVIKGSFSVPSQYHYTMETQCCTVTNIENGLVVRSSTQWMDLVQVAVSQALNIQENQVEVQVPRVGGAYGGKASRSAMFACACALVARALSRTATLAVPLTDNMQIVGKRQPCRADYEIGINSEGVIQYLDMKYYSECGYSFNDSSGGDIVGVLTNLYETSRWGVTGHSVLTDKHSNTWCRAPGTTEGIAILEHIMHRIAHATKKDPSAIKIQHLLPKHESVKDLLLSFKTDIKYDERKAEIEKYNAENAWKKRALDISIMSYPIGYSWNFPVSISVYHADGTVGISHGGIEMGQGINTKVAQVCAYTLKVPLDKISVRGSDTFTSPNAMASNGSITSECVAFATIKACNDLTARMEPARAELAEPTWEEVVKRAYKKGISLQASAMTSDNDALVGYSVYGACAVEVELDVLTGNHVIARSDLLEDTGVSMSPEIDVGQIEGAFIMGLGLWTSEHLAHAASGRLLTARTWTYKPPGARDVPTDCRVSFKRNAANNAGVLRSKATGEPALTLAVVVTHSLRSAIAEARKEYGYADTKWIDVDTPFSVENILKAISPKPEVYKLK